MPKAGFAPPEERRAQARGGPFRLLLDLTYRTFRWIAGYLSGLVWATVCALGIEAIRYFSTRRPEVHAAEANLDQGARPIGDALRGEAAPA